MRWLPTTIRIGWYRSYRSSACWLAFASRRSLAGFLTFRGEIERGLGPPRRGFHRRFPLFKQGSRFDSSFDESIKEVFQFLLSKLGQASTIQSLSGTLS